MRGSGVCARVGGLGGGAGGRVGMATRWRVAEARGLAQLGAAARLRAASFYEGAPASSLRTRRERSFAEAELRGLLNEASLASGGPEETGFCCLVALAEARADQLGEEEVAGTLDLAAQADWTYPANVTWAAISDAAATPPELGGAVYLSNMCVKHGFRRQGVGRLLLREAARVAEEELGAAEVFAHAFKDDTPSVGLYAGAGFVAVGPEGRASSAAGPRPTLLLRKRLRA